MNIVIDSFCFVVNDRILDFPIKFINRQFVLQVRLDRAVIRTIRGIVVVEHCEILLLVGSTSSTQLAGSITY